MSINVIERNGSNCKYGVIALIVFLLLLEGYKLSRNFVGLNNKTLAARSRTVMLMRIVNMRLTQVPSTTSVR
jgi:hypothetical protein